MGRKIKLLSDVADDCGEVNIYCSNCAGFICGIGGKVESFEGYCGLCGEYTYLTDAVVGVGHTDVDLESVKKVLRQECSGSDIHARALENRLKTRVWWEND